MIWFFGGVLCNRIFKKEPPFCCLASRGRHKWLWRDRRRPKPKDAVNSTGEFFAGSFKNLQVGNIWFDLISSKMIINLRLLFSRPKALGCTLPSRCSHGSPAMLHTHPSREIFWFENKSKQLKTWSKLEASGWVCAYRPEGDEATKGVAKDEWKRVLKHLNLLWLEVAGTTESAAAKRQWETHQRGWFVRNRCYRVEATSARSYIVVRFARLVLFVCLQVNKLQEVKAIVKHSGIRAEEEVVLWFSSWVLPVSPHRRTRKWCCWFTTISSAQRQRGSAKQKMRSKT